MAIDFSAMPLTTWIPLAIVAIAVVGFVVSNIVNVLKGTPAPTAKLKTLDEKSLPRMFRPDGSGIWTASFNGKRLHASAEDRALVIGPPGTGKTMMLIAQLVDWMATGRSAVLVDIKPEIWGIIVRAGFAQRAGYRVVAINPTCPTTSRYNFCADVTSYADLDELVSAIIPITNAETETFVQGARKLLVAVLLHLGSAASLPAALRYILDAGSTARLLDLLQDSHAKQARDLAAEIALRAANQNLMASILTALTTALGFLHVPEISAALAQSDFSIGDLAGGKTLLVLQFDEATQETTRQLYSLFVSQIFRRLITNHLHREPVLLLLDELINASRIPGLEQKLQTIRSRNIPTVLYVQNLGKLDDVYGMGAADRLLSACDLRVFFRVGEKSTAEFLSQDIGKTPTRTQNVSSTRAPTTSGRLATTKTVTHVHGEANIIEPEELKALDPGEPGKRAGEIVVQYKGQAARARAPNALLARGMRESMPAKGEIFPLRP